MNKVLVLVGTMFAAAMLSVAVVVMMYFSYTNRAVGLENRFKAEIQKIKGAGDNMWKIIEGKAGVTSEYKDAFLAAISAQNAGRQGGDMVKVIKEVAPNLDPTMYRDVANAIEGQRTIFRNAESNVLSIIIQHDDLRTQAPGSFFCSGRAPLEYKVITSARTEHMFETGQDNADADPFRTIRKQKKDDEVKPTPQASAK